MMTVAERYIFRVKELEDSVEQLEGQVTVCACMLAQVGGLCNMVFNRSTAPHAAAMMTLR